MKFGIIILFLVVLIVCNCGCLSNDSSSNPSPPNATLSLKVEAAPAEGGEGTCIGPITLGILDSSNTEVAVTQNFPIGLRRQSPYPGADPLKFYADSNCSINILGIDMQPGISQVSFYLSDAQIEILHLQFYSSLGTIDGDIAINAGPTATISTNLGSSINSNQCTAVMVNTYDSLGQIDSDTISGSAQGDLQVYSDSGCSNSLSTVTTPGTIYILDPTAGDSTAELDLFSTTNSSGVQIPLTVN